MNGEREETERQKQTRQTQEATIYRVRKDPTGRHNMYRLSKLVIDVETETYDVTLSGSKEPFCSCPGFLRQKFDLSRHKHVRAVLDYITRGCPQWADYKFIGGGANTKIRFLGAKE